MIFDFLKKLIKPTDARPTKDIASKPKKTAKKRAAGYRAEVLDAHGFEIPPSNVDKNLLGIEFEKLGEVEKAIACYEGCIKNNFEGSHPYDRLAIIFRRLGKPEDEIRVLERAIAIYSTLLDTNNYGVGDKLETYKKRLQKIQSIVQKNKE